MNSEGKHPNDDHLEDLQSVPLKNGFYIKLILIVFLCLIECDTPFLCQISMENEIMTIFCLVYKNVACVHHGKCFVFLGMC